jgi:hypothetical protein
MTVLAVVLAACKAFDPQSNADTFAACCGGLGTCVPSGLVAPDFARRLAADTCGSALLCAPTVFAENPKYAPASCRAPGGIEGRCLAGCLPEIAAQALQLTRATCLAGELCAPCYDPRSGEGSGACHIGGDPGPADGPYTFAYCCGQQSRCVPRELLLQQAVAAKDLARLGADSCQQSGALCVPSPWLDTPRPTPDICRALGNLEGRCLPSCLPDVAKQAHDLQQRSCATTALCVPCYDPRTGEDSNACRTGSDAPHEPARTFGSCCGQGVAARGRCVPREVLRESVNDADLARLNADTCSETDTLCVPQAWLDSNRPAPVTCRAAGDFEGRCLSTCLPDVAKRESSLAQLTCSAGELCVPCYDPRAGEDSGACRTSDDMPHEAARTFDPCCGAGTQARGRCVPSSLLLQSLAASDLKRLGADSCSAVDTLCIPAPWLDMSSPMPASCHATGGFEGRCLSSCLPDVAAQQGSLQQNDCSGGDLCVPCYDPRTGADSGACRIGSDQPRDPPQTFGVCCQTRGRCVPRDVLLQSAAESDLAALGMDTCEDADTFCVPQTWLATPRPPAPSCRAPGNLEGRCLSTCLAQVAKQAASLRQTSCAAAELCVPCYDPRTGDDSHACRLGTDAPKEPASTFGSCCGSGAAALGICVPIELLSSDQQSSLPADRCSAYAARCAPEQLLATGANAVVQRCGTSPLFATQDGVCMPDCFLGSTAALLVRASCSAAEHCIACSLLPPNVGIVCQ